MTREEAVEKLKALHKNGDRESAHVYADEILCEFLKSLGYSDVVEAWDGVGKWYA